MPRSAAGKGETFATLRPFLGFAPDPEKRYEDIAAQTGTPVATLKTNVFRLRKRWRELLFEQVAITLDVTSETDGELVTTGFDYDGINRITKITHPQGNPATVDWTAATRTVNRGAYREVKTYDGFGREIQLNPVARIGS